MSNETHTWKRRVEKEHSTKELRNSIKYPNDHVIEVPEEEKIENKEKNIRIYTLAVNLPKLMKEIKP